MDPLPPWAITADCPNPNFENGICTVKSRQYTVKELVRATQGKPIISVTLSKLRHNLTETVWGDGDLSPMVVIGAMKRGDDIHREHVDRILYAQLAYPLIINSAYEIMDGSHRLAHAYIAGNITVDCVMLTRDDLRSIGTYV